MHDVLSNVPNLQINCLDEVGFVKLVDTMPRLVPEEPGTSDFAIVQAARVSYGQGTKSVNEDKGLIRYLMRHAHTTPLEMIDFKFHLKMPIFCARQVVRHRMVSMNEVSARYSVMKDEFYLPKAKGLRQQSKANKQGGEETEFVFADLFASELDQSSVALYGKYTNYIKSGLSREQARMMLPINLYTEFYWKINLHNLLHFLALRCDTHAQYETRIFADAMLALIQPIVPVTVEAWNDYHDHRGAVKLTRLEVEALRNYIEKFNSFAFVGFPDLKSENKGEIAEWASKAAQFGIPPKPILQTQDSEVQSIIVPENIENAQ